MDAVVPKDKEKFNILLLTHRDSDNLGDQILELCDCALIETVMKNLGISKEGYVLKSRRCGILSPEYFRTKDPALLKKPEKLVKKADLLIFGGAPVLNYRYENFAQNTSELLKIAEKYQTPVIFSAAGVDGFDDRDPLCLDLMQSLANADVRQATTRDDLDALKKLIPDKDIPMERVSDPAVFSSIVFRNFITEKRPREKKKIGIFVLRSAGFTDNGISFTKNDMAALWKNLTVLLGEKGYDYDFLTSGYVEDEAMLDELIREHCLVKGKCTFNMNTPEQLIKEISSFDAVISTRMHPSIVAYSLGVPSVSLLWNPKVKRIYEAAGYADRCLDVEGLRAEGLIEKLESALSEGVKQDPDYFYSVYRTLFCGIKNVLSPENKNLPFSLQELIGDLSPYPGTSDERKEDLLRSKFRRIYRKYNSRSTVSIWEQAKEEGPVKALRYLRTGRF